MTQLFPNAIPGGKIGIHWFEQSSYALKDSAGTLLLVDPYFPTERPADTFIHAEAPAHGADLPAKFVLLTHSHGDHTHPESIAQIRQAHPDALYIGPQDAIFKIIKEAGVGALHTMQIQAGEKLRLPGLVVHAVHAKPPAGNPTAGIAPPDVPHLGFVLEFGGARLYFSGDPIHTFPDHDGLVAAVAVLKPDIGFLTTHPSEGEFPFFEGSARMARAIGLPVAVPAHYDCFVKRNYDPLDWAKHFGSDGPQPLILSRNSHIVWP